MKSIRLAGIVVMLAAIGAQAGAETGKTREQVRSELAEAVRNGDIAYGESGQTQRELFPSRYAATQTPGSKTRAQVNAELAEAIRDGDIASGEAGLTARERDARRHPMVAVTMGKTRAQVKAELAEAIRTGEIAGNGEAGEKLNEIYPQRYANVRSAQPGAIRHAASAASAATP